MTGEMTIKCITEADREGLSVHTCFKDVNVEDRLQVMHAVATALHMEPSLAKLWATMYSTGVVEKMFSTESVYDHSERRRGPTPHAQEGDAAFRELDELFKAIFGGNVK